MGFAGFFKKIIVLFREEEEENDDNVVLPEEVPDNIAALIRAVNWKELNTAYGNAMPSVPRDLGNLFSKNSSVAMQATHSLWCGLCDQHVFISSAASPAYSILKEAFADFDDKLKVEILDIFLGLACCSVPGHEDGKADGWIPHLRQKMKKDLWQFRELAKSDDEEIAYFASEIVMHLCR